MASEREQRPISIDGSLFVVAGGTWKFAGSADARVIRWVSAAPPGFSSVDGALVRNEQAPAVDEKPPIAWRSLDAGGTFAGLVQARNALDALRQLPEGHSVYLGGPSPDEPDRPWWASAVDEAEQRVGDLLGGRRAARDP